LPSLMKMVSVGVAYDMLN